jgi:hypothetical protein
MLCIWMGLSQCPANSSCSLCNTSPVQCLSCANNHYCISIRDYPEGDCYTCETFLSACQTCNLNCSTCLSCQGTNIYLLLSGNCIACSSQMIGCSTCSNSTVCLTLANQGYFLGNSTVPQLCSTVAPNCKECTATSTTFICLNCQVGYALNGTTTCPSCNTTMPECIQCSSLSSC